MLPIPAVTNKPPLNKGQAAAAEGFFEFLFTDAKELVISGPGGVGKTFLMSYLIDEILPRYHQTCSMMQIKAEFVDVIMTATTNQAAEVLSVATQRPTSTIHSLLGLKVMDDYQTGKSHLTKSNAWTVTHDSIIFIDEFSGIDWRLLQYIREGTCNCKIVYVGDHCQLLGVGEKESCVYNQNFPTYHLTEPMRNAEHPELVALCDQLRETVETGVFKPIQIVPGVIDLLSPEAMQETVDQTFINQTYDSRILAYTNQRVNDYNAYIRQLRNLGNQFEESELLISNSAWRRTAQALSVQDEVEIICVHPHTETKEYGPDIQFDVYYVDVLKRNTKEIITHIPVPFDPTYVGQLIKYFGRKKDWHTYFALKNTYPDFRPRDASTTHKAQGSTYDTAFIDLGDFSSCRQPNVASRLLNVGCSRARNRIFFFGDLVDKYGGLIKL